MKLTTLFIANSKRVLNGPHSRAFVTSSKPLQKDKPSDEKVKETSEKVTEAADAVKDGAKEVQNMTKTVSGKVTEAADNITDKAKETAFKAATEKLKEKIIGK